MDISNLTKLGSVTPAVAKATGDSFVTQSTTPTGNSLPDAGQVRVRAETPLAADSDSPPSSEEFKNLNNLVDQANTTLQDRSSDLKFTIAEGTDISVVRVVDAKTGELIRQFPSEEMVAIARALNEAQQGSMLEEKA